MNFREWKKLFDEDKLSEFSSNQEGLLWLKLKAISRKNLMSGFITSHHLRSRLESKKVGDIFEEVFYILREDLDKSHQILDNFILATDTKERSNFKEDLLVSELYKMKNFNWGGDHNNSLDRHLVDRYVKEYWRYNDIAGSFENGIYQAVEGYVLCSWYNHWSSILIENIFKEHKQVIPAIGKIKKVDFFINKIPFDLKVTYFPQNYIESKRKQSGLSSELSALKTVARKIGIYFDSSSNNSDLLYQLLEKIKDKGDSIGIQELHAIKEFRNNLLDATIQNPKDLILNLYEQQGELRFDASNRLFLILVDKENFDDSWKLKRNANILRPSISRYLDTVHHKNITDLKISFAYKNKGNFESYADTIFVVK